MSSIRNRPMSVVLQLCFWVLIRLPWCATAVVIRVLDNEKHYWVGDDEVEKLLRHGSGWLSAHPEKEEITNRYLKYRRDLAREALARLVDEESPDPDLVEKVHNTEEEVIERP